MEIVKKHLYDILAVVMFAVISFVYFMPADIDGRILYRMIALPDEALGVKQPNIMSRQVNEHDGVILHSAACRPIRLLHLIAAPTH